MSNIKQKSVDAIIWNLIEKYGNQIVSLVIGVILARLLTPADYGLIGLISVFFILAKVFINSGFGAAYIQKKNTNEVDASTIFYFNVFLSIVLYLVLWFSAPFIAQFYEQVQLVYLTRVSAVVLIISSFGMMQITKLTKEVNFKKKSIISLLSTIISGIVGITAALYNFGVWSLVFQQITIAVTNTLGLWLFYNWRPLFVFSFTSLKIMFSFSAWILLTNLLNSFFNNIYILFIGKFYPAAQLGFFTKARGYKNIVTQHPFSAISAVSFPIFSKIQNDKMALKNSMRKFLKYTIFYIAPIVSILIVIANPLIFLVLTKKWLPMVPYFQLLLIIGHFSLISIMNGQLLNAQGKSSLNFKISLLRNILRLINVLVMYKQGIIYIIYGELVVTFIHLFIIGYFTKKTINYGIIEQLKDVYKIYAISLIVTILGYLLINYIRTDFSKIMIGIIFSGGLYFLFHYLFNKEFLLDNLVMIKNKIKND